MAMGSAYGGLIIHSLASLVTQVAVEEDEAVNFVLATVL
jgi:hypothetical protein